MDDLLKHKIFAIHAAAAAGSVVLGTALTYPLDTFKVLIQVGSNTKQQLTLVEVIYRVLALSGTTGLYNGIGWSTMGRTLGLGTRFGVYEILTAFCKDGRKYDYIYPSEVLMAGLTAGAMECLVSSPFEIVKIRGQVASAARVAKFSSPAEKSTVPPLASRLLPRNSPDVMAMRNSIEHLSTLNTRCADLFNALKHYPWMMTGSGRPPPASSVRTPDDIISLEGWAALWKSLRAGLIRDSIFGGIFFSTWQVLYLETLEWKTARMGPKPRYYKEAGTLSPVTLSLMAGISGAFAAAASHGFDTTRTRSQCTVLPKYVSMERRFLKWPRPGNRFERLTGIHPADRNLLLSGIWLRMARCGVASSVIVGSYYFAIHNLITN